jgi:protein tyrosine phosphatase (PTP) superfamily phosphohydrolase (DUF442 family)
VSTSLRPRPGRITLALGLAVTLAPLQSGRPDDPPVRPSRIEAKGIENLFRLSPRLYSGGQPEGEPGFAALRRLGVRTIISVDGPQPDVEAARRHGLSYTHLPLGYDGISSEQAARLVKAARERPGPVFIHCHHGQHRGPAAAAVCGMALDEWSREDARAWLEQAGTSPDYAGLFAAIDGFVPPTDAEIAAIRPEELPEAAEVPALIEAMAEIDAIWDELKLARRAGFRPPPDPSGLDPSQRARLLAEALAETSRLDDARARGEDFLQALAESRKAANDLAAALGRNEDPPAPRTSAAFARVASACTACHRRFRDR